MAKTGQIVVQVVLPKPCSLTWEAQWERDSVLAHSLLRVPHWSCKWLARSVSDSAKEGKIEIHFHILRTCFNRPIPEPCQTPQKGNHAKVAKKVNDQTNLPHHESTHDERAEHSEKAVNRRRVKTVDARNVSCSKESGDQKENLLWVKEKVSLLKEPDAFYV